MQYLLLMYLDEPGPAEPGRTPADRRGCSWQLAHQLTASGQYLGGAPLQPPSTATSVRVRNGKQFVTDGPFAETREQLGGYMLIDVTDRDEATAIAARGAGGARGDRRNSAGARKSANLVSAPGPARRIPNAICSLQVAQDNLEPVREAKPAREPPHTPGSGSL